MLTAVVDTNVWIAALRSRRGASFELLRLVGDPRWQLHGSTALMLELEEVAQREAARLWAHPERVAAIIDHLCAHTKGHNVSFRWRPLLRDPDDDFVLELAVTAGARYLVTHNARDFAGAERFGIELVTPGRMLLELQNL